jgi:chromosomal replication initiator protein
MPLNSITEGLIALERKLAQRIGEARYELWFGKNIRFTYAEGCVVVGVPNHFYQDWLQTTFNGAVKEVAQQLFDETTDVRFVIDPSLYQEVRRKQSEAESGRGSAGRPAGKTKAPVPPAITAKSAPVFKSVADLTEYVVGDCNRLAYTAAQAVAQRPESAHGPLTIHGPRGVGKTSLLEAACQRIAEPLGDRVYFLTAEDFTNRFIQALQSKKLPEFRRQFRQCQALLVDDIQFFAGKEKTELEFLHTFDALRKLNRPILLACEFSPRDVAKLSDDLVDRLMAGGVWPIELPDRQTRYEILLAKAKKWGYALPKDVANFLADHLHGSVRELEGTLHNVHHYSEVHRVPISLASARGVLSNLRPRGQVVQLRDVEAAVCKIMGVQKRALRGSGRSRNVSHPRMITMCLARKLTAATYEEIGRYFGGRDHSTVIAAERRVQEWIKSNEQMRLGDQHWTIQQLFAQIQRELDSGRK